MPTVFISGAASGIGLAFLAHYAQTSSNRIVAVDRVPIKPSSLSSVPESNLPYISCYVVDVTSTLSITALAAQMKDTPIDLLIHSAGIRGLVPSVESVYPNDVARAETLDVMDTETMLRTFHINAVGTFELVRALLPSLRLAASSSLASPSKVVVMGSRMGSLSYNTTGSAYAYRASKAALNAIVKSFSVDVPDVVFAIVHPGRVETRLVMCREEGAIEADESVKDMLGFMEKLGGNEYPSGGYWDRFGGVIGW